MATCILVVIVVSRYVRSRINNDTVHIERSLQALNALRTSVPGIVNIRTVHYT